MLSIAWKMKVRASMNEPQKLAGSSTIHRRSQSLKCRPISRAERIFGWKINYQRHGMDKSGYLEGELPASMQVGRLDVFGGSAPV